MKKILLSVFVGSLLYAQNFQTQHVKVTQHIPIYEEIIKQIPHEECKYEKSQNGVNSTVGSIIGGVAGGVLGHQVGGGSGKTAATIAGGIVGTMVGGNIANSDEYKKVCKTVYTKVHENSLIGYDNVGYYQGQKIVKFAPEKLRHIAVNISY